ncbi:MaoC/PaaZ C-terminal domain-containing protein [Kribbella sp. NPDC051952]|uniref:MaoC/PaaZ C-terminal domain-containing protein n=1 Tax=Kribbella sp. NPDC051952 TaxID=3154851 RepID=UPI00343B589A
MTAPAAVLAIGDTAWSRTFGPVTRSDIVRYAGASGDFNPIHHDEEFARSAGFSTVFSIGMFQASLLASFATQWLGADRIRQFGVRFREQVWPGDVLTCSGRVTAIEPAGDQQRVEVELTCTRQDGSVAVTGTAVFAVPTESADDD